MIFCHFLIAFTHQQLHNGEQCCCTCGTVHGFPYGLPNGNPFDGIFPWKNNMSPRAKISIQIMGMSIKKIQFVTNVRCATKQVFIEETVRSDVPANVYRGSETGNGKVAIVSFNHLCGIPAICVHVTQLPRANPSTSDVFLSNCVW